MCFMIPDYGRSISGDEFLLTDDQIMPPKELTAPTTPTERVPVVPSGMPHTFEDIPNPAYQREIKSEADTKVMKQMARDQNIDADLLAVRKKFNSVPKSPLDVLKELVAKGTITKNFELFGQTWTLRSLDQSDYIQIFEESDRLAEASGRLASLKLISVVYSLEALNGSAVYNWFSDIKLEEYGNDRQAFMIAIRRAVRRYLEMSALHVVDTLYEKINEIESEQRMAIDELKNF